jgi:hypothetical protein
MPSLVGLEGVTVSSMNGTRNPMRGNIYWLAPQIEKKRLFVSLETSDPLKALRRAEKLRNESLRCRTEPFG